MWPFTSPTLSEAAFILRRLAWADGTRCTGYLRRLLRKIAQETACKRVCDACRQHHGDLDLLGREVCHSCPLLPTIVVLNEYRQHDQAA